MTSMRVCLISPGHLSTNPRLVKEARTLTEAGHDVSIVCGRYDAWAQRQDETLANPSWRMTQVSFGPAEASHSTYLVQTVRRHAARVLAQAGHQYIKILESAHAPAVPGLSSAAAAVSADLYIAHYVAALPAAAGAAQRWSGRYAFDAEDFHLGDHPDVPEHTLDRHIIRRIESCYLPRAAYVSAASPMIAEAYAETYRIPRPTMVLNVFPRGNAPRTPTQQGTSKPGPSLYWFSQTIGPGRGLETAIAAIARAESRPHLYLRGSPAAGYQAQLGALAQRCGVAERLHVLSPAPPDEMERLGAQYDLGYVGELAATRSRQIALTNKLFSYLLSGVPCLASDIASHRALAPELGDAMALFPIGDADALSLALDRLLLDPPRLAAARAHAWRLGQERYCWDVEQRAFLNVVEATMARPRSQNANADQIAAS